MIYCDFFIVFLNWFLYTKNNNLIQRENDYSAWHFALLTNIT